MEIVSNLLPSSLVRIILTFWSGALIYLVLLFLSNLRVAGPNPIRVSAIENNKFPVWIIKFFVTFVTTLLLISIIFNLGEVYQYSYWYKRTFFVLNDSFPFVLILPLIIFARCAEWRFLSITFLSLLLFGGKMTLIASIISLIVVAVESSKLRDFVVNVLKSIGLALFVYFFAVILSNVIKETRLKDRVQPNLHPISNYSGIKIGEIRGNEKCLTFYNCYESQINGALRQRVFSTIGGIWMTSQGGFPGAAYPSSRERFADLMIATNPFGINEKYSISWSEWRNTGAVQNPYFRIGSGYGWLGMGGFLLVFCGLCFMGISNILSGHDRGLWSSLTIYFVFTVFINQTQPWIGGGSPLLFLMGLCAAHILISFNQRHRVAE